MNNTGENGLKSRLDGRDENIEYGNFSIPVSEKTDYQINEIKSQLNPIPVFIHSSFRTSSTWFWSKFRKMPNTLAYYEIFHEWLQSCNLKDISQTLSNNWNARHPSIAPYFLEFLPLLKSTGGVTGFETRMTADNFIPVDGPNGQLSPEEISYVRLLIQNGLVHGKTPILSCTRSLGRVKAIKKTFEINSIVVYRNIFHQWASYSQQFLEGNLYFFHINEKILKSSKQNPYMRMIDECFSERILSPYDENTFILFILMHLYVYAHAFEAADLVVDTTRLATDGVYRQLIESETSKLVGGVVDLSDARHEFAMSVIKIENKSKFIDTIDQFSKLIISSLHTTKSVSFLEKMKENMLTEWERHDFYNQNISQYYLQAIENLKLAARKEQADLEQWEHTREMLSQQVSKATSRQEAAEKIAASLTSECDQLAIRMSDAAAREEVAEKAVVSLTAERADLVARISEATTSREAAEKAFSAVTDERDHLTALVSTAAAEQMLAEQRVAAVTEERDKLAARVSAIDARRSRPWWRLHS